MYVWPQASKAASLMLEHCSAENGIHGTHIAEAVDANTYALTWMVTIEYITDQLRKSDRFNVSDA